MGKNDPFPEYNIIPLGRNRTNSLGNPNLDPDNINVTLLDDNHCVCSYYLLYTLTASGDIIRLSVSVTLAELRKWKV